MEMQMYFWNVVQFRGSYLSVVGVGYNGRPAGSSSVVGGVGASGSEVVVGAADTSKEGFTVDIVVDEEGYKSVRW